MDESQKHHVKLKKPETKEYLLYILIYMKLQKRQTKVAESRSMLGYVK